LETANDDLQRWALLRNCLSYFHTK
jgi:hypothetical protein